MPDRQVRDAVILSKVEGTYGTDSTPAGATDALQVGSFNCDPLNLQTVLRELLRGYMGGFEQLPGDRNIGAKYSVEMVGSGTAGTAPGWNEQLLACGFAETLTASTRADYTPISTSFQSVTNYYHDSGVKHISTGTRGNVTFRLELGDRPMMDFTMLGMVGTETATAQPTGTFTSFLTPQAVTNANTADIVLGCTHSTGIAPALTSGTTYPSKGIRIDMGNKVSHVALLNDESIVIENREVTGTMTLNVTAAQEVQLYADIKAATTTSIGFVHGTVTGRKVLVFMPVCQLLNPRKVDEKGKRLIQVDFRALPSSGNDEIRIVTSF